MGFIKPNTPAVAQVAPPPPPQPPPPPPTFASAQQLPTPTAQSAAGGLASTILTSPGGVLNPGSTQRKTLLGS